MVVVAAGTGDGVVAARIGVDLDPRLTGKRRDDRGLCRLGHELILLGDVQHQGALHCLRESVLDPDPIVANGRIDIGARGRQEGQLAPEAEADSPNLSGAAAVLANVGDGCGDVADAGIDVEGVEELERPFPLGF